MSLPTCTHLPRNPCESVPGVSSCRPPATESPQKRSRCPIPPSTWHSFPAKACQVAPLASHLARNSRESVPGSTSCLPPGTEFPRKCSRCLFPPSTCHGIPAKVFQVSLPAVHLPRNPCESVPGVTFCLPPATVSPQKRVRCPFPAAHLARKSRKSVPCSTSCLPPAAAVPLIMGCRDFSAGQISSFQQEASNHRHT